ncbi:hypothetical protein D3C81_2322890 [compost metagenome]
MHGTGSRIDDLSDVNEFAGKFEMTQRRDFDFHCLADCDHVSLLLGYFGNRPYM